MIGPWTRSLADAIFKAILGTVTAAYATYCAFDRWNLLPLQAKVLGPVLILVLWTLAIQCWRDVRFYRHRNKRRKRL